jgi:hypothetical protein
MHGGDDVTEPLTSTLYRLWDGWMSAGSKVCGAGWFSATGRVIDD